jgi:3-methyladenine DNA glycosylase/8-oxoguanine DNA glycosylase
LNLKEVYSFGIKAIPPYSFELTVHKPAGWWWATPYEVFEKDTFWTATRFHGRLIGLRMWSTGTLQKPQIKCRVFSKSELSLAEKKQTENMLKRALRAEEDLTEFYRIAEKDAILSGVVQDLCGMHIATWPELFPALILAVTLQMAPMKRADQMMELLIEKFGDRVHFDEKVIRYWPSPEKIANVTVEELKAKAKVGYRGRSLIAIAEALEEGFPTMDELWRMSFEEAKRLLLSLRGIGDYSADLVSPGMGFPLDVWSAKIFNILLNGSAPKNPREVIPDLKRTAEERWGKWRGYAFAYVLNDLTILSKRIGFDLTQF